MIPQVRTSEGNSRGWHVAGDSIEAIAKAFLCYLCYLHQHGDEIGRSHFALPDGVREFVNAPLVSLLHPDPQALPIWEVLYGDHYDASIGIGVQKGVMTAALLAMVEDHEF